jgi:hypothetical protein
LKETALKYFNLVSQNRQGKHKKVTNARVKLNSNPIFERETFLKQTLATSNVKVKVPVHTMKTYDRNRGMIPLIPNLGTKWR